MTAITEVPFRVLSSRASPKQARACRRRVSNRQRAGRRLGVALTDLRPIHGIPPRLQVVGATVLVGEIVGVLPDVVAYQPPLPTQQRRVLVGLAPDRELALFGARDEPPAGAEYASARR